MRAAEAVGEAAGGEVAMDPVMGQNSREPNSGTQLPPQQPPHPAHLLQLVFLRHRQPRVEVSELKWRVCGHRHAGCKQEVRVGPR